MPARRDLVVLAADKNAEFAIRGLLDTRALALGLRPVVYDVFVHPECDPGCAQKAHEFLRTFARTHDRGLVLLDLVGSGREHLGVEALEASIEDSLAVSGWSGRAGAVVIAPELEAWVWSDSPHVADALGWLDGAQKLRDWLEEQRLWDNSATKPADPKAAVEHVLRLVRKPRSSAIYRQLATKVGVERCVDPAFAKLRRLLRDWFPP
jgi:hypothetical protein